MSELNASDGSWVQTLSGGCYNFDSPAAIAVAGSHVWVANSHIDQTGGSVTELNASDGSWVRTLSNSRWPWTLLHGGVYGILSAGSYRFINPSVIAAVGSHVWIPDGRTSITVLTDPEEGSLTGPLPVLPPSAQRTRDRNERPQLAATAGAHRAVGGTRPPAGQAPAAAP